VPEYRLTDEHGIDRGVIEETSPKDSGDPDFDLFEVYVKCGTALPRTEARKARAAALWAPLADLTDEDWHFVFTERPDLKARLKAALFPDSRRYPDGA